MPQKQAKFTLLLSVNFQKIFPTLRNAFSENFQENISNCAFSKETTKKARNIFIKIFMEIKKLMKTF